MDIKHEYEISTFTCVALPQKNKQLLCLWKYFGVTLNNNAYNIIL
jgi:hypothetical protein